MQNNNITPQPEEFHNSNSFVFKYANSNVSIFKNFTTPTKEVSISEVLTSIKLGIHKEEIIKIRELTRAGNLEAAKILKKQLESFTPSGTFKNGRSKDKLEIYNQSIVLDIDKVNNEKLETIQRKLKEIPYTLGSFISPSGNGIKIIVGTTSEEKDHKLAYSKIADYYSKALNVAIDSSGSDVCRLCFMSYDPNCYINDDFEPYELKTKTKVTRTIPTPDETDEFEIILLQIENQGVDITGDYETWRNLGFAIADEYGESGRTAYHRISLFHLSYNEKDCDEQYTHCIKSNGSGIGISTFYYHAKNSNVTIPKTSVLQNKKQDTLPTPKTVEKIPTFTQEIEEVLPDFLKKVICPFDSYQDKDMMLLGTLTCISAGLPNVYGIYDNDRIHPNLFLFVSAPASAGKGKLKFCKRIIQPIHKAIRKKGQLMQAKYEEEVMLMNQKGKKNSTTPTPEKPPTTMFVIPANNSATGFFQLLHDNEGKGLIFETEADTLANNFKQDYGNYSDGFRNAFHHEQIKYYRRTGNEYVEIDSPELSCVLSGTPKQVLALMPNAENGLFSRFIFYEIPVSLNWKNVFADSTGEGLESYFDKLGDEFLELYNQLLNGKDMKFTFTQKQKVEFNKVFSNLNAFYLNVNSLEYTASVRRLGIITFRISMIFTVLRILETGELSSTLECLDEDFNSAIAIAKVLVKHSSKVFSSLPKDKGAISYGMKKESFIESLPYQFTTKEYHDSAIKNNIALKTAERYLTELTKSNFLRRESQGKYINKAKKGTADTEGMREI